MLQARSGHGALGSAAHCQRTAVRGTIFRRPHRARCESWESWQVDNLGKSPSVDEGDACVFETASPISRTTLLPLPYALSTVMRRPGGDSQCLDDMAGV